MSNKVFTFGDIRIREVKGKYYVYLIEKDNEGNLRDHYVGPLDKIIETILRSFRLSYLKILRNGSLSYPHYPSLLSKHNTFP